MSATSFKRNEIVILLGAGASVDAGVPHATAMVEEIEHLVQKDSEWSEFRSLYHYMRSAVYYADGLDGLSGGEVLFNIERLVNTLEELRKKERHPLYPFVGAWNPKLLDVAGREFEHVQAFRSRIIRVLRKDWVQLERNERAAYYRGLLRLQQDYEYPLRVFSLNYDLCVEKACGLENVQRGFEDRAWDWRLFDETTDDPRPLLLYKLHGSTDWRLTDDGRVEYIDSPSMIDDERVALIFGVSYKLQYVDPFLFLAYELRRWTLAESRLIVTVGYGFGDEHINGILQQALRQKRDRKLLAVVGPCVGDEEEQWKRRIRKVMAAEDGQVVTEAQTAREFLGRVVTVEYLAELFPQEPDLIPEVGIDEGGET
jgi:hypothetical protein